MTGCFLSLQSATVYKHKCRSIFTIAPVAHTQTSAKPFELFCMMCRVVWKEFMWCRSENKQPERQITAGTLRCHPVLSVFLYVCHCYCYCYCYSTPLFQYVIAGPRLWDQPINLPFQLFPSDSHHQQQQDVSKQQSIFTQQQQQQPGFNQQQSCFQGNFCSQQNCNQQMNFPPQNNNRGDSQNQKIEELNQMFWRTSLKN